MGFTDLRDYLAEADRRGMLRRISGADWNLEIGAIATMLQGSAGDPILLFDDIPGYPAGFRVLANHLDTVQKQAMVLGVEADGTDLDTLRKLKEARSRIRPIPVSEVADGPILEHQATGDAVDLLRFPVPQWRVLEGGRYIGTGTVVISRDPEAGWVNAGTYRQMIHDRSTVGFFVEPNHHAAIIARKYWANGKACPVVVCYGQEEALLQASTGSAPWGVSELEVAGGIRGEPLEVIPGPLTGLPIPARAEIAIEGEVPPPDQDARAEGPFREWAGYYSQEPFPQPVIHVKAMYHRTDPILTGPPNCARYLNPHGSTPAALATWEALDRSSLPGVRGVWAHANGLMIVVSLRQQFAGHAKQALLTALTATASPSAYRYFVAVDDDIDPSDLDAVIWAMTTRCVPEEQIDIIPGALSAGIDPVISPQKRLVADLTAGRVLVNACKPWTWIASFGKSQLFPDGFEESLRGRRPDLFGTAEAVPRVGAGSGR